MASLLRHARSALGIEASLAQNRATAFLDWARLERNLALSATLTTDRVMHLTVLHALALARIAAVLAALRCAEVPALEELLFTFGKSEGLPAVAAL